MSWATFSDYMTAGGSVNADGGERFNIDADSTYTLSATETWANSGTSTSPIIIRGYKSSITDGYQGRTNDNGALVTTNMPTLAFGSTFRISHTGAWLIAESLNVTGSCSNYVITSAVDSAWVRCKVTNSSTNAAAGCVTLGNAARSIVYDCDLLLDGASGGAYAILANQASTRMIANRINVVSSAAVGAGLASSAVFLNNTIYGSGGVGISTTSTSGAPTIVGNTIVGCGGDGIDIVTGTTALQSIIGNMITDNTGNGIDMVSAANAGFLAYNRLRDNSASINSGTDWVTATSYGHVDSGTTGDTSTDYENYAGNDFRLKATSPATSAGSPAKASIGANQRDQTSSGGGGETSHVFVQ